MALTFAQLLFNVHSTRRGSLILSPWVLLLSKEQYVHRDIWDLTPGIPGRCGQHLPLVTKPISLQMRMRWWGITPTVVLQENPKNNRQPQIQGSQQTFWPGKTKVLSQAGGDTLWVPGRGRRAGRKVKTGESEWSGLVTGYTNMHFLVLMIVLQFV
jgi:hypothetical protein